METESFALELKDQLSGPAREMKRSLQELKGALHATGTELTAVNGKQTLSRGGAREMVTATKAQVTAQKDATKAAGAEADALEALGGELVMVAQYALAAGLALGAIVYAGLKLAAEAYTYRKHMENVFEIYKGSAAAGQETYEMVRKMSRTLPIPQEKAFESAQELLSLGLQGQNRLHNTVQAIAYMQGVMGDQAGSKLKSIISSAQGTTMGGRFRGVFSVSPAELKEIGLSYDQLSSVLAQKLGKSNAEVKQMLMYGRIDAATGIDALNDAVSKGAIGSKLKDALLAPDVLFRQFQEHVRDLFKDVDAGPLLKELRNLVNMFDQGNATGRGMKKTITTVFSDGIKVASHAIVSFRKSMLRLGIMALDLAIAFQPMFDEFSKLKDNAIVMGLIDEGFREMARGALMAVVAVGYVAYETAKFLNTLETLRRKKDDFERIGLDIVGGLARGVVNGNKLFRDAMKDLADGGMKEIKDAFEVHSPSRKMMAVGRDLTAGLRLGASEGGLDVYGGGIAITTKALPASRGAGVGVIVTIEAGAIVIQGGNAPLPEMREMVEDAMADLVERIGEELGRGRD